MNSSAGVRNDGCLEWREYNGHLYGTPRSFIDDSLRAGLDVIVKPEVNGALAIKERYPGAVLIFPTTFPTCGAGSKRGGPNQRADRRAFRDRPPGSEVRA
jgi:hypothetical protein